MSGTSTGSALIGRNRSVWQPYHFLLIVGERKILRSHLESQSVQRLWVYNAFAQESKQRILVGVS